MAYTGRALTTSALDPDHLETQFASQMHGPDAGYMIPFLLGARMDRQARGDVIQGSNERNNALAAVFAQRELDQQDAASRRVRDASLAAHGVPLSDPISTQGMSPGGVTMGNQMIVQGATSQMQQRQAEAARGISEAGGNVNQAVFPMLPGVQYGATPRERAAAIGAHGANRARYEITAGQAGAPDTERAIAGNPTDARAMMDQAQGRSSAQATAVQRAQQEARDAGAQIEIRRLPNGLVTTTIQTPDGRRSSRAIDVNGAIRPLGPTGSPNPAPTGRQ